MARKAAPENGRDRLEEAIAILIQNQAAFVYSLRETDRLHAKFERETAERFARIETQMSEIIRVLNGHGRLLEEHGRLLEHLPEAIRDRSASGRSRKRPARCGFREQRIECWGAMGRTDCAWPSIWRQRP